MVIQRYSPLSYRLNYTPSICIGSPSACRNLLVNTARTQANTIAITWERPLITGRDDFYYNIHYTDPDFPGEMGFIQHNHNPFIKDSPLAQYSLSELRPLTNYTIRVTVHNGVSDQDPGGKEERMCQVSTTTGDIGDLSGVQLAISGNNYSSNII